MKKILIEIGKRLPGAARRGVFHFGFSIAREEFEKFAHLYAFAPNMEMSLRALKQSGFEPNTVIDVGAYKGEWSRLAKSVWPKARIIMFEPNAAREPECTEAVAELEAELHQELLGSELGKEVIFHVMAAGSSVLNERSPLHRQDETRVLSTLNKSLDQFHQPALLKVDAQGYELEIIKGAHEHLSQVDVIILEIAVIEINEGAPLLTEVLEFMDTLNFTTFDIAEIHRRPLDGALNQVDLIFVRKDSKLIADKRHFG